MSYQGAMRIGICCVALFACLWVSSCSTSAKPSEVLSPDLSRMIDDLVVQPDVQPTATYNAAWESLYKAGVAGIKMKVSHLNDDRPSDLLEQVFIPQGQHYTVGDALFFSLRCDISQPPPIMYASMFYQPPYFKDKKVLAAWIAEHDYDLTKMQAQYISDEDKYATPQEKERRKK